MNKELSAVITGKITRFNEKTFTGRDGKQVTAKSAIVVLDINGEPFKNEVPVKADSNWEIGTVIEQFYLITWSNYGMRLTPIKTAE